MKKIIALLMALVMVFAFAACGKTAETPAETPAEATEEATVEATEEAPVDDPAVKSEGVMSFADYDAAALDTEVTVETYVQAKQGWWEDAATIYTQDMDGAYFLYSMPCTQEDYDMMEVGTKLKVTGFKAEYKGEIEIIDATYEILEGSYVAEPVDVTEFLGTDDLIKYQTMLVSFKGMTVEAADDTGAAYLYNWDGSGTDGDDLYFNVSLNGETYTFTVESYLTGAGTDVYEAVKALQVGDVIDMEGFAYWYDGINPHITAVSAAK